MRPALRRVTMPGVVTTIVPWSAFYWGIIALVIVGVLVVALARN